ncbi:MAG: hypothetical protein JWL86_6160 [Rhizobium sp.]|nr:hypothetical protein [Rhizobium sp.]
MADRVEFRIFPDDNQWKMNRNDEFLAVFSSPELAIEAAEGYRAEILENGGVTTIIIRQSDGSEHSIQP